MGSVDARIDGAQPSLLGEGVPERARVARVVVDHEGDLANTSRLFGHEVANADPDLSDGFLGGTLVFASHDTCAHCRQGDAGDARAIGGLQRDLDDLAEWPAQIVYDEQDGAECATVLLGRLGEHGDSIAQAGARRLVVEHRARTALNRAVYTTEPHTTRIDGGDECIGAHFGDVAFLHYDLGHNILTSRSLREDTPQASLRKRF